MDRRGYLASVVAAASTGLAGCSVGGQGATDTPYVVGMTASAFEPREVTVAAGETVRWRNTNSRAHTVTAYESTLPAGASYFASGGFDTEQAARDAFFDRLDGTIGSGETYAHVFEVAGEYPYFCIPHERGGMVGTVFVE